MTMIQHFNYKPLYANAQLPGWRLQFFYERQRYEAEYEKDGSIKWLTAPPSNEQKVKEMIHELMLFHVYE